MSGSRDESRVQIAHAHRDREMVKLWPLAVDKAREMGVIHDERWYNPFRSDQTKRCGWEKDE